MGISCFRRERVRIPIKTDDDSGVGATMTFGQMLATCSDRNPASDSDLQSTRKIGFSDLAFLVDLSNLALERTSPESGSAKPNKREIRYKSCKRTVIVTKRTRKKVRSCVAYSGRLIQKNASFLLTAPSATEFATSLQNASFVASGNAEAGCCNRTSADRRLQERHDLRH